MPTGLSLPVVSREVYDNSIVETVARCPRLGFYQYWLNRARAKKSHPLSWGSAVHKFMEVLEYSWIEAGKPTDGQEIHRIFNEAVKAAFTYWPEEPPIGDRRDWMTFDRLRRTLQACFDFWQREKQMGQRDVLHTEQAFTLALPNGELFGGRIDQVLRWNNRLWIRDFKTTSRMGRTYGDQFDPSNQFTGYTWAIQELSGQKVDGIIVNTIYNTKTKGPEVHEHLVTRKPAEVDQWLETIQMEIELIKTYEERDLWPMRTLACNDYGGCRFRDACKRGHWKFINDWLEENTIESVWDFLNPDDELGEVQ